MVTHFLARPRMPARAANETGRAAGVAWAAPRHVATLIPFPPAQARPARADRPSAEGGAEILLFLGVRYERRTS